MDKSMYLSSPSSTTKPPMREGFTCKYTYSVTVKGNNELYKPFAVPGCVFQRWHEIQISFYVALLEQHRNPRVKIQHLPDIKHTFCVSSRLCPGSSIFAAKTTKEVHMSCFLNVQLFLQQTLNSDKSKAR